MVTTSHEPPVWATIAPPMIQMFHVYKAYPGDPPVLSDINLHVEKGEFVFLTGPSGAGKTTLLKLVFCAEQATKGQILVGGRNIARIRESAVPFLRRNIGVVFQDFKLLPSRTVTDNVAFALDVLGVPREETRERVHRMLKLVGLQHKADSFPMKLSGGEQQRVVIARALVNDPTILLADEPTGNLDPALTLEIMDLLTQVNVRGTTVLVATHDTSLIARYQKRTLRLERGLIVSDEDGVKAARRMAALG
jgi:cell division transport system ATP-binding protein